MIVSVLECLFPVGADVLSGRLLSCRPERLFGRRPLWLRSDRRRSNFRDKCSTVSTASSNCKGSEYALSFLLDYGPSVSISIVV